MSDLEARIRVALTDRGEITVRRVLGGVGYFVAGSLAAAIIEDSLCVTVAVDEWEFLVGEPGVKALRFVDRPVPGWLVIDPDAIEDDRALVSWIDRSLFAQ